MVTEALKALEEVKDVSVELIAVSSCKKFDQTVLDSVKKTGKVITVEDHNIYSGLGSQLAGFLEEEGVRPSEFKMLGVREYQLSGKVNELYAKAGIASEDIAKAIIEC